MTFIAKKPLKVEAFSNIYYRLLYYADIFLFSLLCCVLWKEIVSHCKTSLRESGCGGGGGSMMIYGICNTSRHHSCHNAPPVMGIYSSPAMWDYKGSEYDITTIVVIIVSIVNSFIVNVYRLWVFLGGEKTKEIGLCWMWYRANSLCRFHLSGNFAQLTIQI